MVNSDPLQTGCFNYQDLIAYEYTQAVFYSIKNKRSFSTHWKPQTYYFF